MSNKPEAILDWLKDTVNKAEISGEWKRSIIREGQGKICLGDLRGDLSQWLANQVTVNGKPGREIFEGLYL